MKFEKQIPGYWETYKVNLDKIQLK